MGIMATRVEEPSPGTADPYIRLAMAVIARAIREASEGDRGAEWWLRNSRDADLYFDLFALSREMAIEWLDAGARMPEEKRGRKAVPLPARGLQLAFDF